MGKVLRFARNSLRPTDTLPTLYFCGKLQHVWSNSTRLQIQGAWANCAWKASFFPVISTSGLLVHHNRHQLPFGQNSRVPASGFEHAPLQFHVSQGGGGNSLTDGGFRPCRKRPQTFGFPYYMIRVITRSLLVNSTALSSPDMPWVPPASIMRSSGSAFSLTPPRESQDTGHSKLL